MPIHTILGFLLVASLPAQVNQLATSGDGRVLLLHTNFRLQTESDAGSRGKIYGWFDGQWIRLAAISDNGSYLVQLPDVIDPFISADAKTYGWQVRGGSHLPLAPAYLNSEIHGVEVPPGFPGGWFWISSNGRYVTGADLFGQPPKYLDSATGEVSIIPGNYPGRPIFNQPTNDGSVLLANWYRNESGDWAARAGLSLWKPGQDPTPICSPNGASFPVISPTGGRLAFERAGEPGPNSSMRSLVVSDSQTCEEIEIASTSVPLQNGEAYWPVWDVSGTKLLYRTFDGENQPTTISVWEFASRTSRVILTNPEGFTEAKLSAGGDVVWAVTTANRLLRLELSSGTTSEILPAMGSPIESTNNDPRFSGVPGSAMFIRGKGFNRTQMVFDGDAHYLVSDATPEGVWVQIPWRFASSPLTKQRLLIRSPNSPFEAVIDVQIAAGVSPQIVTWTDAATSRAYAKAYHEDFRSLVTPLNPAYPGETVHVQMTGLGPIDQSVPTGEPGTSSPPAYPLTPLSCTFGNEHSPPIPLPFVAYAPGQVGFYRADVTIPFNAAHGEIILTCAMRDSFGARKTGAVIPTISALP